MVAAAPIAGDLGLRIEVGSGSAIVVFVRDMPALHQSTSPLDIVNVSYLSETAKLNRPIFEGRKTNVVVAQHQHFTVLLVHEEVADP